MIIESRIFDCQYKGSIEGFTIRDEDSWCGNTYRLRFPFSDAERCIRIRGWPGRGTRPDPKPGPWFSAITIGRRVPRPGQPGTTKLREITGTQSPRLSRGRPDTGREREAAKLRDETAERNPPCARAASPEYTEAARLDQKGNPRDRLYSRHRVDVEIFARRPRFLILTRVYQVVKVQIRIAC